MPTSLRVDDVNYAGSIRAEVDYKDKSELWLRVFVVNVQNAIHAMGNAIANRAKITVPFKTGNLASTDNVITDNLETTVTFGGERAPYAAYQERGMRLDGTHVVKNYTTPGTGSRYLQNAAESVLKEGIAKFIK